MDDLPELEKEAEIRRKNLLNQRNQVFTKCLNKYCIYWRKSDYPVVSSGLVTKVDTKKEIVEIQMQKTHYYLEEGIVEYDIETLSDKLEIPFSDISSIGQVNKKAIRDEIKEKKQKRIDMGGPFNLSGD